MSHNRATIYSNGIAELSRIYPVSKSAKAKISIPVRQQHLADVLASLTISGDVRIDSPPSYQPANVDDGNLTISTTDSLVSMAKQLAGSQVTIAQGNEQVSGQLVGLQDQQIGTKGEPYLEKYLVVLSDGAIRRVAMKEIESLEFTDPVIQAEINKALSRQLREIKPNSTFVDLELSTENSNRTDAVVQYTIPAAAWKISYRLVLLENKIEFHGHAIVDNNTDEDWNDFLISVVMGQPITFTSDLADSKTPRRGHVNIVQEQAVGAIEVEEAVEALAMLQQANEMHISERTQTRGRMKKSVPLASAAPAAPRKAQIDEAEVAEAGDFCIFQSQHPVSIEARRSAVIPVFQTEMGESKTVLHFKKENHPERPYRAVRFVNETGHSLGRGICTVFDESIYAGSCIVPAMKEAEDTLLPHALDSGVKITTKKKRDVVRRISVQISEGVVVETHHRQKQTDYHVKNNAQPMPLVLDHQIGDSPNQVEIHLLRPDVEPAILEPESLKSGKRVKIELEESDVLVVSVVETKTTKHNVHLSDPTWKGNLQVSWLVQNLIETNSPLADDAAVQNCIQLQRDLDEINLQVEHARNEVERLNKRQDRLRKNIKTGGGEQQDTRWRTDLGKTEDAIVQLEDERIGDLNRQCDQVRKELFAALNELSLQWVE
jgi:hypothetical protein